MWSDSDDEFYWFEWSVDYLMDDRKSCILKSSRENCGIIRLEIRIDNDRI